MPAYLRHDFQPRSEIGVEENRARARGNSARRSCLELFAQPGQLRFQALQLAGYNLRLVLAQPYFAEQAQNRVVCPPRRAPVSLSFYLAITLESGPAEGEGCLDIDFQKFRAGLVGPRARRKNVIHGRLFGGVPGWNRAARCARHKFPMPPTTVEVAPVSSSLQRGLTGLAVCGQAFQTQDRFVHGILFQEFQAAWKFCSGVVRQVS